MFVARPTGSSLRRVQRALIDPHHASERFEGDFMLGFLCMRCGKLGSAPRSLLREAQRVHAAEECPNRHTHVDEPWVFRVLYPKQ